MGPQDYIRAVDEIDSELRNHRISISQHQLLLLQIQNEHQRWRDRNRLRPATQMMSEPFPELEPAEEKPKKVMEEKPPNAPTDAQLTAMKVAFRKLLKAKDLRVAAMRRDMGQKEAEHAQQLERKRLSIKTLDEVMEEETPTRVEDLSSRMQDQVFSRVGHTCSKCSVEVPYSYTYICFGTTYCPTCVPEYVLCNVCDYLKTDTALIKTYDNKSVPVCNECLKNRTCCGNCGEAVDVAYADVGVCSECLEHEHDDEEPLRGFSRSMKWVGKDKGAVMQSLRVFSCEIEALSPAGDWSMQLSEKLPKEMGIGTDGSVGVRGQSPYGFEIQTPRLAGAKGEELLARTQTALKSIEAIVDETCGMHIHLDGEGLIPINRLEHPTALVQLWKSYIVFEDVIISFLPYRRRGNDYCRLLGPVSKLSELDTIETIADAEKMWYRERSPSSVRDAKHHHRHTTRYFGANFHSLFADGHFEVRFHSGTTNPKKILEWANLHALLLDACVKQKITHAFVREYTATPSLSERTKLLFGKIGLAQKSQQYFRERQKKFANKKNNEDELQKTKFVPRRPDNFSFQYQPVTLTTTNAQRIIERLRAQVSEPGIYIEETSEIIDNNQNEL